MKMKKILLITLIFILQSIPSLGNSIEGKGVVCVSFYTENKYNGFFFEGGKVFYDYFEVSKDEYRIMEGIQLEYETTKDTIYWNEGYWKLEREPFLFEGLFLWEGSIDAYECEVMEHLTAYENRLNYLLQKLQNDYDEETKDNLI